MTEPVTTETPAPIHATGTTASGVTASRGYQAIGPSGQLVLMRPGTPLKPGWRFATQADIDAAEAAEAKRRARDRSGEHEDRARQAARAAAKRAVIEVAGQKLTVDDPAT